MDHTEDSSGDGLSFDGFGRLLIRSRGEPTVKLVTEQLMVDSADPGIKLMSETSGRRT